MESSFIRNAGHVFKGLAWIFAAAILGQVFLAGLALFLDPSHWVRHAEFARYFSFVPILMLAVSFIARLPAPLRLQSAVLIGLVILLALSGLFSSAIGYLSAFHPVLALFLFFRTMNLIRRYDSLNQSINGEGKNLRV